MNKPTIDTRTYNILCKEIPGFSNNKDIEQMRISLLSFIENHPHGIYGFKNTMNCGDTSIRKISELAGLGEVNNCLSLIDKQLLINHLRQLGYKVTKDDSVNGESLLDFTWKILSKYNATPDEWKHFNLFKDKVRK